MKIAQVIASRGEGGLEKHVRELSLALSERGHALTVLGDVQFLASLPPHIHTQPIPCQHSRHDPRLLWALEKALRAGRFDIVHAQANKAAALVSTLRYLVPGRRVATLHNIKRRLKPFSTFDQIITVSRQLAKPFPEHQATVVYNGIQVSDRVDLGRERMLNPPSLLAVGRLVPAKGFDVLIKAVAGLPVVLRIAGDGPEREALQALIDRFGKNEEIHLLGARQDVQQLILEADAVVISSRREGFSYVLNEALLARRPVLATDVPVANEVLPERLIVPIDDPDAMQDRLRDLLANGAEWAMLMRAPFLAAERHMTLAAMVDGTLAVYDRLLAP